MNEVWKPFSLSVDSASLLRFFCDAFGLFSANSLLKYRRLMHVMIKQLPLGKVLHDVSAIKETSISILNSRSPSAICGCFLFLKQYLQILQSNDYSFVLSFSPLVTSIMQCLLTVSSHAPHAFETCGNGLSCLLLLCQKSAGLKRVALDNQMVHLVCETMTHFVDTLREDGMEEEARACFERGVSDAITLLVKLIYENGRCENHRACIERLQLVQRLKLEGLIIVKVNLFMRVRLSDVCHILVPTSLLPPTPTVHSSSLHTHGRSWRTRASCPSIPQFRIHVLPRASRVLLLYPPSRSTRFLLLPPSRPQSHQRRSLRLLLLLLLPQSTHSPQVQGL